MGELQKILNAPPSSGAAFPQPAPGSLRQLELRQQLVADVFAALDINQNGLLDAKEMQPFAVSTGFSGTMAEWAQEYEATCADVGCDPARGITSAAFQKLVDDTSDNGCYCS